MNRHDRRAKWLPIHSNEVCLPSSHAEKVSSTNAFDLGFQSKVHAQGHAVQLCAKLCAKSTAGHWHERLHQREGCIRPQ